MCFFFVTRFNNFLVRTKTIYFVEEKFFKDNHFNYFHKEIFDGGLNAREKNL